MRKVIILFLVAICCNIQNSFSQNLGNEWINYNQTYFKFKLAKDSIYRVSISNFISLGLPTTVTGANLQLFRDGQEVPIFVSTNSAVTSSDYIEFFGEKANGKIDAALYKNPALQLNPNMNLLSDTAIYFLTYNTSSTNKRFTLRTNNLTTPPLKETYFWNKQIINYRGEFAYGKSDNAGNAASSANYNLNSSQYEEEGFVKKFTTAKDSITFNCPNPYKVAGGPFAYFKTTVVGKNFFINHQMKIFANSNLIADSTYESFDFKRFNLSVPMSILNAQNRFTFRYEPSLAITDRYGIVSAELRYPSLFNFENKSYYYFELDPKLTDYYLELSNFNTGGVSPRLYDITSNEYLIGDIATAGLVKFLIPASNVVKKLVLISGATNNYESVLGLEKVTFKNFQQTVNQGNYIMISHKNYTNDGNGNNYLEEYKNYRQSSNGGSYKVSLAFTDDIYNEFGYGYNYSCLAIKNFLQYAHTNSSWVEKPKQVFIVGKGIYYNQYLTYTKAPFTSYPFYAIPSFGSPSSDLLLTDFTKSSKPEIPIGRLSAFNGADIKTYLDKVKEYETEINSINNQTSENKLWHKNILHVAGTTTISEQIPIVASLDRQANIMSKPFYGGKTTLIKKSTTSTIETINSTTIDNLINNGVSLIQFFGHSSASTLDFNLDIPENYKNNKKYFVFLANGCGAGNIFEATGQKLLSERFVLAPKAAAIAFIANVNTGYTGTLGTYTDSLYNHFANASYGKTIGEQLQRNVYNFMDKPNFANDFLFKMHCEQILINGDPAIKMFSFEKPDYAVEEKGVNFKQINLNSTLDSIDVDISFHNLGKYVTDSFSLFIKRILPNGVEEVVFDKRFAGLSYTDTLQLKIPTYKENGIGQNYLSIEIDQEAVVEEISELNNKITRSFVIYNDDLVPVYPYAFSIINMQGVTLKASTLNPFAKLNNYIFQIDTTEKFNSPLLQTKKIESSGGVLKWQPIITLNNNVVYYWRTAMDTSITNAKHKWTTSSFVYIDQSLPGWNQSHYFQFQNNAYQSMYLDTVSRTLKFVGLNKKLQIQNTCLNGPAPFTYTFPDQWAKMDGATLYSFGCDPYPVYSSLQFVVIDTLTGKPWINQRPNSTLPAGRFGSFDPCRIGPTGQKADPFFEFSFAASTAYPGGPVITATEWRQRIMNFIDSIPQGYYVMFLPRLCLGSGCGGSNKFFVKDWKSDTTTLGANNSLYHKLKNLGYSKIDSFYKNRPMVMWSRKGMPSTVQQYIGADSTVKLYAEFDFNSTLFEGNITSPIIGPSKLWSDFKVSSYSNDASSGDSTLYEITGINLSGSETLLATVKNDTSLTFINASTFPYLRLKMKNADNVFQTPTQKSFWRIHFQPQPEAALNPNRHFIYKDTVGQGQISKISVAVENLTDIPMDSLLVKYTMIDKNNKRTILDNIRYKPLPILDTIHLEYNLNSSAFTNDNVYEIEVNPSNDQLEQFHPNNIGLKSIFIVPDNKNPLIDVTFDGIHILDRDIVSAKPFINITLKDENKYLALDDTSLVSVFIRYNAASLSTEEYIPFDNNKLKFIPPVLNAKGTNNQARIEFRPEFTVDGDDYMLIVKAKDKTGNLAGSTEYKVAFKVVTKSSISSLLNYPNPFTTSTQFLFTLTGSEIPSQLKIQILSPTGKIVREITKSELGNIHIGRNLTEFRWNGDDQFGQPLANGVYLYRLVSSMNGSKVDHFTSGSDKWIEKGFGKLYIMR